MKMESSVKKLSWFCISLIAVSLVFPTAAYSKRPSERESVYVSDIIQKASELEKRGNPDEAEEILLDLLENVKKKTFRKESEWLSYMHVLRTIIAFYYRQGEFKEADWYLKEYSNELDDDDEESGMHAIIVYDVSDIAGDLIDSGDLEKAEETFLYLTDRLENRFGYDHWLVRLTYKNIIALYVRMNNSEMAEEYSRRLNPKEQ
jgi:hypothetical protein